jgi:membrane fusion protein, multidrug efflux system
MNKVLIWTAIVAAAAAIAGGSYWYGTKQVPAGGGKAAPPAAGAAGKSNSGPPPVAVDAGVVKEVSLSKTIFAVGSLRSDETVIVRPEVSGRIAEIGFKEGQRVVKGSVLIRLDQSVQRAELQQADANLALAKSRIERARDLHAKGFISGQSLDEAESNYKVSKAAYDLAAARLTKLEIKAPFSGIAGLRLVSLGDYVREGQDIVNIEEIDPLKLDFRVPEIFLKDVAQGQELQLTFDAIPNKTFVGKVFAINPLVDASGRAVVVRATVRNTDVSLRPGMFARVSLITNQQQQGLTIPEQALIPVGDDFFVFKIAESRANRTKVDIGQRRTGFVEITKGLLKDDLVVIAGQPKLRDGSSVKVATVDGAPSAKSADAGTTGPAPGLPQESNTTAPKNSPPPTKS